MINKRSLFAALALIMALLFVGCSANNVGAPTPTPEETPVSQPTATPEVTPENTPEKTPEPMPLKYDDILNEYPGDINPVTGLPLNGGAYKPILVTISGATQAYPHSGISKADIIFEIMHDTGSVTRFLAVFSQEYPDKVGPIRSSRVPYLQLVMQWPGAGYAYGGNSTIGGPGLDVTELFSSLPVALRANGVEGPAYGLFFRSDDRVAPHNLYLKLDEMLTKIEQEAPKAGHMIFDDSVLANPDGKNYEVNYHRGNSARYEYDAQNHVYWRFSRGVPFIDKENDQQISVTNVIVRYVEYSYSSIAGLATAKLVGEGKADFLVDGTRISGTWKQDSLTSQTLYFDDQGDPIRFKPGKTFIDMPPATSQLQEVTE